MMQFFGVENKYGRPVPYVWFLIIMVSIIPLILIGSVTNTLPCTETDILNGRTPDEYQKEKEFTIKHAINECVTVTENVMIGSKVMSVMLFGSLLFFFKPYPLSNYKKENKKPWNAMPKNWEQKP